MILSALSRRVEEGQITNKVTILLVGEGGDGRLSRMLAVMLGQQEQTEVQHCKTVAELEAEGEFFQPTLVVALSTYWRPVYDRAVQRWCFEHDCAFLRVSIWQHEAVIGPLVPPGETGCVECAERRRFRSQVADTQNELRFLAWCEDESHLIGRPMNPWITQPALTSICAFTFGELDSYLQTGAPQMGWHSVRFIRLLSLNNTCHRFLPDPMCDLCARLREDREENAIIQFQPRVRPEPGAHRLRTLADELELLEERYLDSRMGLQFIPPTGLRVTAAAFATTLSFYYEYPQVQQQISCAGFSHRFRSSRATAIAEALERYSGFLPRGRRAAAYGSYKQLRNRALDPTSLGLYSLEQYAQAREAGRPHSFSKYDPDLPFNWTWGYSLRHKRPILVPEQVAYYAASALRPDGEQFINETSNGCAVGGSIEEATLYGLFEVVERDAFLLTWYGRLSLPALDWQSTRDTNLKLSLERAVRMTGFDFYAFDATTDMHVPVVLAAAVNRKDEAPKFAYAAACHLDPDKAMASAFYEVVAGILCQQARFPAELEYGERLVQDSSLVRTVEDHVLLGDMPSAFSRMSFLLREQSAQSMQKRFAAQYAAPTSHDLTEDLQQIIARILERGYDVIIIDQTAPELAESELHCVRVLVPGMVPMTFGHDLRRTHGLERLYRMPKELGYTDRMLSEEDLNQDPHAFP